MARNTINRRAGRAQCDGTIFSIKIVHNCALFGIQPPVGKIHFTDDNTILPITGEALSLL
jgi:hypothetical protein